MSLTVWIGPVSFHFCINYILLENKNIRMNESKQAVSVVFNLIVFYY